jgi:hypothetical protein
VARNKRLLANICSARSGTCPLRLLEGSKHLATRGGCVSVGAVGTRSTWPRSLEHRRWPDASGITSGRHLGESQQLASAYRRSLELAAENGIEIFWSMRMNDIHDQMHRAEKPHPFFPKLKEDHPEYLVGWRGGGGCS